ncbi:hypothetical protein IAT38_006476 [Cryptococcus sp. DSM 104549]
MTTPFEVNPPPPPALKHTSSSTSVGASTSTLKKSTKQKRPSISTDQYPSHSQPHSQLSSRSHSVSNSTSHALPQAPVLPQQPQNGHGSGESSSLDLTKVRAFSACKNCRVKKVKCLPGPSLPAPPPGSSSPQAEGPAFGPCQQCLQAGVECTYPPTRDRAAYSRQYVANLETRVQNLELLHARVLPLLEAFEGRPDGVAGVGLIGAGSAGPAIPSKPAGEGGAGAGLPQLGPSATPLKSSQMPESDGDGEGEGEDDPLPGSPSDLEDAGQITQDERGNYRWIGSSNTLSLLDSFSGSRPTGDSRADGRPSHPSRAHSHRSSAHPDPQSITRTPSVHSDHGGGTANPYFGPVAGSGVVKALPGVDEVQYPTEARAAEMVDAFFQEVHPCLPVVLEWEFRRDYKRLVEARARGESSWGGGFISVVFAIFALGERVIVTSRAWQREREKAQRGDEEGETVLPGEAEAGVIWYERAQILHYTTLRDVNIHQVQCLTLLAAFQASVNAMPMSWLLAGQALRVAQDLGLHRSTARLPLPFPEKQLRARCWWAIYGLERMMSITLGRPLGVDDLDIDVAYPADIDDEGLRKLVEAGGGTSTPTLDVEPQASTMSGFVALTKLCKIAGRVAHLLYRPSNGRSVSDQSWAVSQQNAINKLDKLLRDWLDNEVPPKYKDASDTRSVSLVSAILSNSYFTILITLHRNFLPSNPDFPRPKPPPDSQSLAHCVDAARSVIHIASQSRTLIPPTHHLAVFCQYLWSSAVILLLCEVQARDTVIVEAVSSQVDACRRCLQALEPVWPGSRKLKELLNDVSNRAKEVVHVAAVAPKAAKKRKSTAPDGGRSRGGDKDRQMPPPTYGPQPLTMPAGPSLPQSTMGHWTSYVPTGSDKRQRVYETSDSRTLSRDEEPSSAGSHQAYYPTAHYTNPMSAASSTTSSALQLPMPSLNLGAGVGGLGAGVAADQSETFDLGGVTFDALDLLQGFGDGASTFWNNFTFQLENGYPSGGGTGSTGGGTGHQMFSGHSTPNSTSGSGPSPSNWQGMAAMQAQPQGQGGGVGAGVYGAQGQSAASGPGQVGAGMAEFWEQVAGNSFDWQADPNVPFNI